MAYISRSCDFPKVKMGKWVTYIIRSCDQITKKEKIKRLCKQFFDATNPKKSQKNSMFGGACIGKACGEGVGKGDDKPSDPFHFSFKPRSSSVHCLV